MRSLKKIVSLCIISICFIFMGTIGLFAAPQVPFDGNGTKSDPYLIDNYEDLCTFRDLVNRGNTFENQYVLQTKDIDMKKSNWTPIGLDTGGHYFFGIYDGGGHTVKNLYIGIEKQYGKKEEKGLYSIDDRDNNGFFGKLGGTVVNFGIESGKIDGRYCGSIASSAIGEHAAIINCYNKASVRGSFAGGIAESFVGGVIASCWSTGKLEGGGLGGILSSGGDLKVYRCYATSSPLAPNDVILLTSAAVTQQDLFTKELAKSLSKSAALGQYLFANEQGATLMQWQLNEDGELAFSKDTGYIDFLGFVNLYLLPILLLLLLLYYTIRFYQVGKNQIYFIYSGRIKAAAIIFGIISVFINTALWGKGLSYLNFGNGLFILLVNGIFIASLIYIIKNRTWKPVWNRQWIPLLVFIAVVVVLELCQFDLVPRLDGRLYYGSFVKSIELFRLDFLTYIGAFICWKWAQGVSLLIAPFEFIMTGEMIGVYISNVIITIVTLISFYWLLRRIFTRISPILATLSCAILIFSPYGLGLFTYLCMDWHTPFFLVWLLCAYLKKNDVLISFFGFLLAFTKVSSLAFYVFFLITMAIFEIVKDRGKPFWQRVKDWWNWRRVILWILPGIAFIFSYYYYDLFMIQNFYASDTAATVSIKSMRGLANTLLQTYVYGFRWIFILFLIILVVLLIAKRKKLSDILHREGTGVLIASTVGCIAALLLYCIYNGIAECPRYTAMYNMYYALSFAVAVSLIFRKEIVKQIITGFIVIILLIQTYWTIDPSIIMTCDSIDTGKKQVYKIALPNDKRVAMSLGTDHGSKMEVIGDIYVHNLEYAFYDDLDEQLLKEITPTKNDYFYFLDVMNYETHIFGMQYNIYWNTRLQKRTYDGDDRDSILPKQQRDITTEEISILSETELNLADSFYFVVPDRVDESTAIERLKQFGYKKTYELHPENIYGKMSVYKYERK